ncbi:MAG: hypothetical protein ACKN9V_01200 [Pseudomonadota bacterium]
MVESLLLTLVAAMTVIFILPEFGKFTVETIEDIRSRLGSITKDGEVSQSEKQPGQRGHPSNPERFKALHF